MATKPECEMMRIIAQQQEVIATLTTPAHNNDVQNMKVIAQQQEVISTLSESIKRSNQPNDVNKPEMIRLERFMKNLLNTNTFMRKEIESLRKLILELEKNIEFLTKSNSEAVMLSQVLEESIEVDPPKEKEDAIEETNS